MHRIHDGMVYRGITYRLLPYALQALAIFQWIRQVSPSNLYNIYMLQRGCTHYYNMHTFLITVCRMLTSTHHYQKILHTIASPTVLHIRMNFHMCTGHDGTPIDSLMTVSINLLSKQYVSLWDLYNLWNFSFRTKFQWRLSAESSFNCKRLW